MNTPNGVKIPKSNTEALQRGAISWGRSLPSIPTAVYTIESFFIAKDCLTLELRKKPEPFWVVGAVASSFCFFIAMVAQSAFGCFLTFLIALLFAAKLFLLLFTKSTLTIDPRVVVLSEEIDLWVAQWPMKSTSRSRNELLDPVSWISPARSSFRLQKADTGDLFLYETRLPLGENGIVLLHDTFFEQKRFLERFRMFLGEFPCEVMPNEEEKIEEIPRRTVSEKPIDLSRVDRQETALPHDFEAPPRRMVSLAWNGETETLRIVAETDDPLSRILGRTSWWICVNIQRLLFWSILLSAGAVWFYWNDLEPLARKHYPDGLAFVEKSILARIDPEIGESFADAVKQVQNMPPEEQEVALWTFWIGAVFCLLVVVSMAMNLFFALVRWPFWKRWTVELRNGTGIFDWRNDRYGVRSPKRDLIPFFRVVAATPKTHRFLTNRLWVDRNPAWRMPFQVVFVTTKGVFSLPCADAEEQAQIIRAVEDSLGISDKGR